MFREKYQRLNVNETDSDMTVRQRKTGLKSKIASWISSRSSQEPTTANGAGFWNTKVGKRENLKSVGLKIAAFAVMTITVLGLYSIVSPMFKTTLVTRNPAFSAYHDKVSDLRPEEVINPSYDNMYVSILTATEEFRMEQEVHDAIGTFLQQVRYLQVCNSKVANTFVGGSPKRVIPFLRELEGHVQLERYIHALTSMYETQPSLDWYIQIDHGNHL